MGMKLKLDRQRRPTRLLLWAVWITMTSMGLKAQAPDPAREAFERGIVLEESEHDLGRASQAYEEALRGAEERRALHATLIFRLAEARRRMGRTNEASELYQRLVRQFPDQPQLVASAQRHIGGGTPAGKATDGFRLARLLRELNELDSLLATRRERLRQVAERLDRYREFQSSHGAEDVLRAMAHDEPGWTEAQDLLRRLLDLQTARAKETPKVKEVPRTAELDAKLKAHQKELDAQSKAFRREFPWAQEVDVPRAAEWDAQSKELSAAATSMVKNRFSMLEVELRQLQHTLDADARRRVPLEAQIEQERSGDSAGSRSAMAAAGGEASSLLLAEIEVAEQQLRVIEKKAAAGQATDEEVLKARREVLALQRQWAEKRAGDASTQGSPSPGTGSAEGRANESTGKGVGGAEISEEDRLLARLQRWRAESPDLLTGSSPGQEPPLVTAAGNGWIRVIHYLLELGPEGPGPAQRTQALLVAARAGLLPVVKALLDSGADPKGRDSSGMTALHHAAGSGYRAMVEVLLQGGADPAAMTDRPINTPQGLIPKGATPLKLAIKGMRFSVAELLLQRETRLPSDPGALVAAAEVGWTNGVARWLALGAQPHSPEVMHAAVSFSHLAVVQQWVAAGTDVNVIDPTHGLTPLHRAAARNDLSMAKFLLAHGASVNAGDKAGASPWDLAVSPEMKEILAAHGGRTSLLVDGAGSPTNPVVRVVVSGALSGRLPAALERTNRVVRWSIGSMSGTMPADQLLRPIWSSGPGSAFSDRYPLRLSEVLRQVTAVQSGSAGYAPDFSRVIVRIGSRAPLPSVALGTGADANTSGEWESERTMDLSDWDSSKLAPAMDLDLGAQAVVNLHVPFHARPK